MSNNKLYIAAAGSGKTTFIFNDANKLYARGIPGNKKILIVTFTTNNQENIRDKFIKQYGYIPPHILVIGWYTFLLDYWICPFKGSVIEQLYDRHVGVAFVSGISGKKKFKNGQIITTYHSDTEKFLDETKCNIYSDRLAEFAFQCRRKNKSDLIDRLSNIVDTLYIDEVQDLAAWDYDILSVILKSGKIKCVLCGDPRQHTYSTTSAMKNSKYRGDIADYIRDKVNTRNHQYAIIDTSTLSMSHRCCSEICAFASKITPGFPPTVPCACQSCLTKKEKYSLHRGVFWVREKDVQKYVNTYKPLSLIWNKRTKLIVPTEWCLNWGESKGLQAKATLIYLTKELEKTLNDTGMVPDKTRNKFYVAVTRAEFTVGLIVHNDFDSAKVGLPFWAPDKE